MKQSCGLLSETGSIFTISRALAYREGDYIRFLTILSKSSKYWMLLSLYPRTAALMRQVSVGVYPSGRILEYEFPAEKNLDVLYGSAYLSPRKHYRQAVQEAGAPSPIFINRCSRFSPDEMFISYMNMSFPYH